MRLSHIMETYQTGKVLYHVTNTSNVPSIVAKGLLRMQTSNWVKAATGKRYGNGEVFAFENQRDALRWAGRMDYEFNRKIGTGNISIVEFEPGENKWEEDDADPIGQAGAHGAWLKSKTAIAPIQIKNTYAVTKEMVRDATQ